MGGVYILKHSRARMVGGVGVELESRPDAMRHDALVFASRVARSSQLTCITGARVARRAPGRGILVYSIARKRIADPLQIKGKTKNRQRALDNRGITGYSLNIAALTLRGGRPNDAP